MIPNDRNMKALNELPNVIKELLGIRHWRVDVHWRRPPELPDDHSGKDREILATCSSDSDSKEATICVDIEPHPDVLEITRTLRHEMLHILHAEFSALYSTAYTALEAAECEASKKMLNVAYSLACERFVRELENSMEYGIPGGGVPQLWDAAMRRTRK